MDTDKNLVVFHRADRRWDGRLVTRVIFHLIMSKSYKITPKIRMPMKLLKQNNPCHKTKKQKQKSIYIARQMKIYSNAGGN